MRINGPLARKHMQKSLTALGEEAAILALSPVSPPSHLPRRINHPALNPPDSSPLAQACSCNADTASSSEHLYDPVTPARCECPSRFPADESQSCGAENGARRFLRCLSDRHLEEFSEVLFTHMMPHFVAGFVRIRTFAMKRFRSLTTSATKNCLFPRRKILNGVG